MVSLKHCDQRSPHSASTLPFSTPETSTQRSRPTRCGRETRRWRLRIPSPSKGRSPVTIKMFATRARPMLLLARWRGCFPAEACLRVVSLVPRSRCLRHGRRLLCRHGLLSIYSERAMGSNRGCPTLPESNTVPKLGMLDVDFAAMPATVDVAMSQSYAPEPRKTVAARTAPRSGSEMIEHLTDFP